MSKIIYTDHGSQKFRLLEHFVVTAVPEDQDWVKYQNIRTEEIFTCRLEAFEERFYGVQQDDR
jgi:hypothetical protein